MILSILIGRPLHTRSYNLFLLVFCPTRDKFSLDSTVFIPPSSRPPGPLFLLAARVLVVAAAVAAACRPSGVFLSSNCFLCSIASCSKHASLSAAKAAAAAASSRNVLWIVLHSLDPCATWTNKIAATNLVIVVLRSYIIEGKYVYMSIVYARYVDDASVNTTIG